MWWRAVIGWGVGLWVAAGCEAGFGIGYPGPLLLVAIAAGLSAGPVMGAVVGLFAGLLGGALAGGGHFWLCAADALAGALAGVATRWVSRRNPAWALLAAGIAAFVITLILGVLTRQGLSHAGGLALRQAGVNLLLMIPVYGVVLLLMRRTPSIPEDLGS